LELSDPDKEDQTAQFTNGRFDFIRSCRWHRFRIHQEGAAVINGIDINFKSSGQE
jgi:hypothetical protein